MKVMLLREKNINKIRHVCLEVLLTLDFLIIYEGMWYKNVYEK